MDDCCMICGELLNTEEEIEVGKCKYCIAELNYCEICGEELTENYEVKVGICIKCIDSGM